MERKAQTRTNILWYLVKLTWNKIWIAVTWVQYQMNLYPIQYSAFYTAKLSWTFEPYCCLMSVSSPGNLSFGVLLNIMSGLTLFLLLFSFARLSNSLNKNNRETKISEVLRVRFFLPLCHHTGTMSIWV